ncbi:alpha/beta hydrolase [Litorimonas cladophorae]|uniref:Alpha/beta hydrolase n=1 Tax=Litorimonas cladophorae TaxID=1220491 RepID=A0A918KRJ4_9PROT|nr:alpha/beta hydrolase [Litorimonas cladophorae]GGX73152.1 alpha/beta hydrolase [Litorimonas cladophorae]
MRTVFLTEAYKDIFYNASDGLELYARDYRGEFLTPTILCMHGLTRNSADFHNLALQLRDKHRVISVDQRGRGLSAYDPDPQNYRPDIYCGDMFALMDHLQLPDVIAVGTSMGGLMTMMMAAMRPKSIRAAVINDIGPEIDPAGLERIKGYVGNAGPFRNWDEAVAAIKAQGPDVFPLYTEEDWINFSKRTCRERQDGSVEFAYDPALSTPFRTDDTSAAPPDLWPVFDALRSTPLLIIRGATSDILSPKTARKMQSRHPDCIVAEIPDIGHAPMLDEPESLLAIQNFLKAVT